MPLQLLLTLSHKYPNNSIITISKSFHKYSSIFLDYIIPRALLHLLSLFLCLVRMVRGVMKLFVYDDDAWNAIKHGGSIILTCHFKASAGLEKHVVSLLSYLKALTSQTTPPYARCCLIWTWRAHSLATMHEPPEIQKSKVKLQPNGHARSVLDHHPKIKKNDYLLATSCTLDITQAYQPRWIQKRQTLQRTTHSPSWTSPHWALLKTDWWPRLNSRLAHRLE